MQINLNIFFDHPDAVSNTVRYARIDNTVSPVYTTLPGVVSSPLVIENVPNGQYRVFIKPIYADGRACPETQVDTAPCTGIQALSAIFDGGSNFVVSYTANGSLPFVQVNIAYPNGGSSSAQYSNTGSDIHIPVPAGVTGTFFITMQPVCDAETGFLGAPTSPVSVIVPAPSP